MREWELQIETETGWAIKRGSGDGSDPSLLCSPDVRLCAGLPSTGLWDRPSLVKPTDSMRRTAVHRSSALPLTAEMWDRQTPLFVYTWSLCTYCACLLAFCVRVVFWWSPMAAIVLHGHHILKFLHLAADDPPEVLQAHATMSIFKSHHILGLLMSKTAPDVRACNCFTWNVPLVIAV